ncbi:MAG: hypothetical protein ACKE51_05425 [Methylococcaceae bacterium]
MSKLHDTLAQTWFNIQTSLFPWLSEELGELTDEQQELVATLEMIRIEEFISRSNAVRWNAWTDAPASRDAEASRNGLPRTAWEPGETRRIIKSHCSVIKFNRVMYKFSENVSIFSNIKLLAF